MSLTDNGRRDQQVAGQICSPEGGDDSGQVEITIPGSTYTSWYFNSNYRPETYSYALSAVNAGRTVVLYDKIGTGGSTKPSNGDSVTIQAQATVVHQMVQALRNGDIGGREYPRVVLNGHSLGSFIALTEAARYSDVDAVLASGFTHEFLDTAGPFLESYQAAPEQGGRFVSLPETYFATAPEGRSQLYSERTVEAGMLEADLQTMEATTSGERNSQLATLNDSLRVRGIPVLLAVGEDDIFFCGRECLEEEFAKYPLAQCVQFVEIPGTGHMLNTSTTARQYYDLISIWLDPEADRCQPIQTLTLQTVVGPNQNPPK